MNEPLPAKVCTPKMPGENGAASPLPPHPRLSGRRLVLAFALAALADGLSVLWTLTPPVQWIADGVTAILLFALLGWQWILLPGLIMEAIPGLYIFPFWVMVVAAVAVWGTARPKFQSVRHDHPESKEP